jgi:hypothetical protein
MSKPGKRGGKRHPEPPQPAGETSMPRPEVAAIVAAIAVPPTPPIGQASFDTRLDDLTDCVRRLKSPRCETFFLTQPPAAQAEYARQKLRLELLRGNLAAIAFEQIAAAFAEEEDELEAATANLRRALQELNDAIRVIETTAAALNTVARILALAA